MRCVGLVCVVGLMACGTPEPKPLPPSQPTSNTMPLPWNPPEPSAPAGALSDGKVDGAPRTCRSDAQCVGSLNHCAKDTPDLVGICTRTCTEGGYECGTQALWTCGEILWDLTTQETKNACILMCTGTSECPYGTYCQPDNVCGNAVPPQTTIE